ncbi:Stf0 family sulfotransferase [Cognatishimia sp. SS12]|uniref:Stf0 family sulfotransferase n=1 Tax=Cognatishimia sp. SS12 TaxID=2979465 RepID=UPI00232CA9BA|nr:Stf0 family sulfotransferase [Cognatishimia sp. SS12]MDC0739364.1 Stf0 family sulfotransferase [Cognatishimia sp. SS12]
MRFPPDVDKAQFAALLRQPPAHRCYAVFFTARSGSSWLTDVAARSGVLGLPDECFNPRFVPNMAQNLHAASLDDYMLALRRRRNIAGCFGCELTAHHLRATFGGAATFMRYFDGAKFIWLLREDIVLQGVSLMKMQQTRISHLPQSSAQAIGHADNTVRYDAAAIKRWITHSFQAEERTEALLARYGLAPLRLSYEKITQLPEQALAQYLADYLVAPKVPPLSGRSAHKRIATALNTEYAARFRQEEAQFLRGITQTRWRWVQKVAPLSAAADRDENGSKTPAPPPAQRH